jgi:hypothetical protein
MVNIIDIRFLLINSSHPTNQSKSKFLSSLHENLFLSKIFSLAILFSCFIRESDHDEVVAAYLDDEANLYLNNNEEYLQTIKVCLIIFMRRFF